MECTLVNDPAVNWDRHHYGGKVVRIEIRVIGVIDLDDEASSK